MHKKLKMWILPAILLFLNSCSMEPSSPATGTNGQETIAASSAQAANALPSSDETLIREWADRIYPGTTIAGIDVGGLTVHEARSKVEKEIMEPLKDREVRFSYANTRDYMSYKKLKVAIDESVYENALASGKTAGDADKLKYIREGRPVDLQPVLTFDEDYVDRSVETAAKAIRDYSREKVAHRVDGRVVLQENAMEEELDREAYKKAIIRAIDFNPKNNKYIEAETTETPTTVTQAELDPIDTKLTTFTTRYKYSVDSRKYNITLAAELVGSTLVMPGSEFSFNRAIGGGAGERNGFQSAGVYSGLELVEEPGGGVCQVSSTLYNVLLNLGITPTQRDNHGMKVSYLPAGMDAVVYAPYLDLKFVNPFENPIYITTKADGEELRFTIYGAADALKGYSYKYEQEVYDVDAAETKEVRDSSIPNGAIVLDPAPKDGFKAKVYKLTYKDGKLITRELYTDNEYARADGKLLIGTGSGSQVAKDWYKDRTVEQYPPNWDGPRD